MTRPGLRLRAFAARFCSARTMERLIDPTFADLQREYVDARRLAAIWTARWVLCRGFFSVAKVVLNAGVVGAWHTINHWTPGETAYLRRSAIVFLVATTLTTMAFAYLRLHRWDRGADLLLFTIYLIPSILPLTTAWAAILAIACGSRERLTRKLTGAVLAAALACSMAMFADLAWVIPDSNQAFREVLFRQLVSSGELVFGSPPARGENEMSLSDLRRQIHLEPERARNLTFTYHSRWALSAAPLILAGFALLLVRSIKRRPATVTIACALCVGYWVALRWVQAAMSGGYPVVLSAWLPNLVVLDFCLLAGALAAQRRFSRLTDSG
jgi:hypothetical protein